VFHVLNENNELILICVVVFLNYNLFIHNIHKNDNENIYYLMSVFD